MQGYHSVTWVSASLLLVWTTADDYICGMCGRVIQSSGPLRYVIVDGMNVRDSRVHNYPPREFGRFENWARIVMPGTALGVFLAGTKG